MNKSLQLYGCKGDICGGIKITGNQLITVFFVGTVLGIVGYKLYQLHKKSL